MSPTPAADCSPARAGWARASSSVKGCSPSPESVTRRRGAFTFIVLLPLVVIRNAYSMGIRTSRGMRRSSQVTGPPYSSASRMAFVALALLLVVANGLLAILQLTEARRADAKVDRALQITLVLRE